MLLRRVWYSGDLAFLWHALALFSALYALVGRVWFLRLLSNPPDSGIIDVWRWGHASVTILVVLLSVLLVVSTLFRIARFPGGGHLRLVALVVFGMISPSLLYAVSHYLITGRTHAIDVYHVVGILLTLVAGMAFIGTVKVLQARWKWLYVLMLAPALVMAAGQMAAYTFSMDPTLFFRVARDLYFLVPAVAAFVIRGGDSRRALLLSLAAALVALVVLGIVPQASAFVSTFLGASVGTGWYSRFLFAIQVWALVYCALVLWNRDRWGRLAVSLLLLWWLYGYGPYHSSDVWPQIAMVWGLVYVLPFVAEPPSTGVPCGEVESFLQERIPSVPFSMECEDGVVRSVTVRIGEIPEGMPDWESMPMALVSSGSYLASPSTRMVLYHPEMEGELMVLDNNFYTEEILGESVPHDSPMWTIHVRLWWAEGLEGTIYEPSSLDDLEAGLSHLVAMAVRAGVVVEEQGPDRHEGEA